MSTGKKEGKLAFALNALGSVSPIDRGLAGGILSNLAGTDRASWRRVYETAHRGGIGDLPVVLLVDQRPWLEAFFQAVLEQKVDCSDLPMASLESHSALMLNPRTIAFPELVERIEKYFGLPKSYRYKDLSQVRSTALGRPVEGYTFAHVGGLKCYMSGISYDKAKADKLCFLDETEYMLITAYNKWCHGSWLDVSGWTRLDALWPDDKIVNASWNGGKLDFDWGDLSHSNAGSGPRSAIIL